MSAPRPRRWPASSGSVLVEPIRAWIEAGRPFLGICLGLQLLYDGSDEDGAATLGVLAGRTVALEDPPTLPHIGWNQVERRRDHPILAGVPDGADLYFVHSYAVAPADPGTVVAETTHGGPFPSVVAHGPRSASSSIRSAAASTACGSWPTSSTSSSRAAAGRPEGRPAGGGLEGELMLRRRVIPCLDVADGRVVKGTRFVDLVDEGDPAELAARYAAEGADELVFLDITAAPERRATLLDVVERTARNVFIPLTVGGGVRSVDEMRAVLRAGADKVAPEHGGRRRSRAGRRLRRPVRATGRRGRDRRAATTRRRRLGGRRAGRPRRDGLDAVAWAVSAVELGAGELLVTSIDRDGTRSGFDTDLLRAISGRVRVPVIASGGAGGPADFVAAIVDGGADAVLAASIFHRRIHAIGEVKAAMAAAGLPVRASREAAA